MTEVVEQTVPELTINDLISLKSIIDLASSRGAYKTIEMVAVGQAYARLFAFVDHVTKQAEAAQAAQPEESANG